MPSTALSPLAPASEYIVGADEVIITRTDLKGRITYANDAFLASSGYALEEVMGRAHSLVRHPEMPRAAFSDLWQTLQRGQAWSGVVKNLRKDGSFYWVRAYVSPAIGEGGLLGYVSVRVQASRAEIAAAEAVYATLDGGAAVTPSQARQQAARAPYLLSGGQVIRRAWPYRTLHWLMHRPVAQRLVACCVFLSAGAAVAAVGPQLALAPAASWLAWAVVGLAPWVGVAYLHTQVLRPAAVLTQTAQRVIGGEPLARFPEVGDASMRALSAGLNQLAMRNVGVLRDVQASLNQFSAIGARMQQSSESLAASAEQQSASLSTVSGSVSGVVVGVRQTAAQSGRVNDLSGDAVQLVRGSEAASREVQTAFERVKEATEHIGSMLQSIRAIATQTHLLAINTRIEAAHAATAGRGFAVIATEVRGLAEQVSTAVEGVERLNAKTQSQVDAAAGAVARMGDTVRTIDAAFGEVGQLADEVARTTQAQGDSLREAADALAELDAATQHNALLAEHCAGASQAVVAHARRLLEAIDT